MKCKTAYTVAYRHNRSEILASILCFYVNYLTLNSLLYYYQIKFKLMFPLKSII